jgi:ribosomal protein S18 acetylase RimI-like enzyme
MTLRIGIESAVSSDLVDALRTLVTELSDAAEPPNRADVERIVASPCVHLITAREGERIVGCLTLLLAPTPTGLRGRIEDVVVTAPERAGGAGTALVTRALEEAAAAGARTVDLTSRPSREAANRLYERLGFVARETTAYRRSMGADRR